MKCREKNSEKIFLKVENTEAFWEELKKINVKVILISEKGVAVSDYFSKYFAEFGEYLIVSNDGYIEVCCENEFNRRYEVIDGDNGNIFEEKIEEMRKYVEVLTDGIKNLKKVTNITPEVNVKFGDLGEIEKINEDIKRFKKRLSEVLKI